MWPLWASTSIYTGFMLCVAAIPPIYLEKDQASIYVGVGIPVLVIVAAFVHYILVSRPLSKLLERIDSTLEQRHITESHQRNVLKRANDLLDPNNNHPSPPANSSSPQMSLNYSMKHQQRLIDDLGVGSYHSEMFNLQAHVKDLFQSLIREQQALYKLQIETVNTAAKSPQQGSGGPGALPVGGNFTPLGTSLDNSLSLPVIGGTTPRGATSVAQQSIYGRRAASASHRQGSSAAATTAAPVVGSGISPAPEAPPQYNGSGSNSTPVILNVPPAQIESKLKRKNVVPVAADASLLSDGGAPPERNTTAYMENSKKEASLRPGGGQQQHNHAVVMIKDPLEDPKAFSEPGLRSPSNGGGADGDDRTSYASLESHEDDDDEMHHHEFESRRLASESLQPQLLATPGQFSSTTGGGRSPSAMVPSPVPIIKSNNSKTVSVVEDSSSMKAHGRQNSNQILAGGPSPLGVVSPLILERGSRFAGDNRNICLYMKRSKNGNLVVYEGKVEVPMDPHQKPGLNVAKPLEGYWLDVDPKYVEKARAKGKMDDREDLSTFEFKFAYGFECTRSTADNSTFTVVMKALKKRNLLLGLDKLMVKESKYMANSERTKSLGRLDEHNTSSGGGANSSSSSSSSVPMMVPTMRLKLNGIECIMDHIYVHTKEGWGLPTVEYVELHGFALKTGDKVMELIKEGKK